MRGLDAAVQDPDKPYWIAFTVDYAVIGYVAAICVLTGILFGLAPALHVSKTEHQRRSQGGRARHAGSRRVRWFSGTMVVVELALTIVLLAGAGLMIRSFLKLYTLDIGIRTEHLTAMRMQLPASKYATADLRRLFFERLESRLAAIPGVEAVAVTTAVPPLGERAAGYGHRGTARGNARRSPAERLDRHDQSDVLRRRRRAAGARTESSRAGWCARLRGGRHQRAYGRGVLPG